ncbi:unnamed protein product [Camellia sinensis]
MRDRAHTYTCHPFPAESKGTTVHSSGSQDRATTNCHCAKHLSRATLVRPQMGKFHFLVDTPAALAAFREEYGIPADVHLELAEEKTTPWGRLDQCPFTVLSIVEGGLRFPVNPLMTEFLRRTGLAPTQVSTNTYRIINGVHELIQPVRHKPRFSRDPAPIHPRPYQRRPRLLS